MANAAPVCHSAPSIERLCNSSCFEIVDDNAGTLRRIDYKQRYGGAGRHERRFIWNEINFGFDFEVDTV